MNARPTNRFYRFGLFQFDAEARVLLHQGSVVRLPPKAIDILKVLLNEPGRPVDKKVLIQAVWPDTFVEENNLAHHVSLLRKALSEGGSGECIETIPKRGYRFAGEVTEESEEDRTVEQSPPEAGSQTQSERHWPRRKLLAAAGVAIVAAMAWWLNRLRTSEPLFDSLAVLPFQNLTGDPEQEYVSDGLTESLITEVSAIEGLRVISRTSVMGYKTDRKPLPEIARELGVGVVIEGSVARFGNKARVMVQLLDGPKDKHLWAGTYDRDLVEIPKLWEEVAISIAHEIRARARPEQRTRVAGQTTNRDAYEAYLRGRYYWNKRTGENIHRAVDFFRKAIDADPAYAAAYAGLADCYNQLGTVLIGGKPPSEMRPLAIATAQRALEIDPELSEAHAALAYSKLYDWEWSTAEAGFQKAIRLNPNYASAHLWYAHYLSMWKRREEALREVRLAERLDPLSPIIQTQVGWILQHAGRHDEAIAQFRKVLGQDPDYLWALWRIGSSYASKSMYREGIEALEKAAALSGRSPSILGTLAETYGLAGRRNEARRLLNELLAQSGQRYIPNIALAHAYIGADDPGKVLESLERAYQNREQGIAWLAIWEDHGAYRRDARFRELLRRTGLPER